MERRERRETADEGFVGGFEGLLFGVLIFVAGGLLVAAVWATVDTKLAVADAARVAARTYVEAGDSGSAATASVAAADTSLQGWGLAPRRATVQRAAGSWARCSRVTIVVRYPAPALELPWIGRVGGGRDVSAAVSELVDPLRSGLPGVATCG